MCHVFLVMLCSFMHGTLLLETSLVCLQLFCFLKNICSNFIVHVTLVHFKEGWRAQDQIFSCVHTVGVIMRCCFYTFVVSETLFKVLEE